MRNHTGHIRGFSHLKEAWYGEACLRSMDYVDEVVIGFYCPDGGTSGEFGIRWQELCGKIEPQIQVWGDSWSALNGFKDFIEKLAEIDNEKPTPQKVCEILLSCGVTDMTKRVR